MAIVVVNRIPIGPVPPLMAKGLELELEKWLPAIPPRLTVQRIDTQSSVAVASSTSTPILVLPSSRGLWIIAVGIGAVGDAVNYQAMAFAFTDGTSCRLFNVQNAPLQTIANAGLTISSVQTSGGPQQMVATAIQLTNF